jgi:hypothetical protein
MDNSDATETTEAHELDAFLAWAEDGALNGVYVTAEREFDGEFWRVIARPQAGGAAVVEIEHI